MLTPEGAFIFVDLELAVVMVMARPRTVTILRALGHATAYGSGALLARATTTATVVSLSSQLVRARLEQSAVLPPSKKRRSPTPGYGMPRRSVASKRQRGGTNISVSSGAETGQEQLPPRPQRDSGQNLLDPTSVRVWQKMCAVEMHKLDQILGDYFAPT